MNKIRQIPDVRPKIPETPVTLKITGSVLEVKYMRSVPGTPIRKLDKDHGLDLRTGEVIEYKHHANRASDKASVAQSLRKLRDIINANLENPDTALWVTLTYAENMRDTTRLYEDYRRFWQRFRYYLHKQNYQGAEYITAARTAGQRRMASTRLIPLSGQSSLYPECGYCEAMGAWFY